MQATRQVGVKSVNVALAPAKGQPARQDVKMAQRRSLPVGIFQGCDTVTGTGLSMALTGDTQVTGGYSQVQYRVCTGIEQLSETLGVNQSLSASFWSSVTVSEKFKFVNDLKLTTHSTCIVITAKHHEGVQTATNWKLSPDIQRPDSQSALLDFVRVYGDCFVSSRTTGGEYHAVYTFYAESQQRQSELTAELHAQGLFSVVKVDASLQAKLSKIASTQTTRVSFDQIISGIRNPHFPTADNMVQYALDFPSIQLDSPVVTNLQTTGYERVPGIGTHFDIVANNRKLIANLQPKFVKLKQLQNSISDITDIYGFYGGYTSDNKLLQVKKEAENDAKLVEQMITGYEEYPTKPLKSPQFGSLAHGVPSLRYQIQKVYWWRKQTESGPFDHVDKRAYLQQKTRIAALQLGFYKFNDFKQVIKYFQVTYTRETGGSRVVEHGNKYGARLTEELLLSPGRVAISTVTGNWAIEGGSDLFCRGLGFHLSDQRKVSYGDLPVGTQWEVPRDSFLLGFCGNFDGYISSLGFVYASFKPSSWAMV